MTDRRADDDPPLASEVLAAAAVEAVDPLAREVARATAAAALFGRAPAVRVGRYQVRERIGAGGMGAVWTADDDELGRTVALKLATTASDATRARALREGRALAALSHPNVVPIYDVVDSPLGVFLVMEWVRGETLRAFAARTADPRAIVRAYRQAADGLAAAHAAGLVHRDFKPDNAVVGGDGRVRVLDFGLAVAGDDDRTAAGTPRYMAPEQRTGEATPAVDQYALCASLREALGRRAPRWLAPILERGTAVEPAARFPSMAALAAALGRDPRTIWRRRGVVAALAATGIAGVLIGRGQAADPASRCDGGAALAATAWTERRAEILARLGGLAGDYPAQVAPRLVARLDELATAWTVAHRDACRAHARGELAAAAFDRRGACLSEVRTSLATTARLLAAVEAPGLPDLVTAVAALPTVARCGDDAALASPVAPPAPTQRAAVAAVDALLAEAAVLRDAAVIDGARALADQAVTAAAATGYPPAIARAHLGRGRIDLAALADARGAPDFAIAIAQALTAGDDRLAVEAFARHAFAIATGRDPAAVDGLTLIEPLAARLGPTAAATRALLYGNLGAIALSRDDRAAARARFTQAAPEVDRVAGPEAVELAFVRYGALVSSDDAAAIADGGAALIAELTQRLGAEHPETLRYQTYVATLAATDDELRRLLEPACRALATLHPQLTGLIAECSAEAALVALIVGDRAAAGTWAGLHARATAGTKRKLSTSRAAALAALARGDAAAARAALEPGDAWLRQQGEVSSWLRIYAYELALLRALAARASDDPVALVRALAVADGHLSQLANSDPATILARRRANLAALAP
jgi:hypothetical protein